MVPNSYNNIILQQVNKCQNKNKKIICVHKQRKKKVLSFFQRSSFQEKCMPDLVRMVLMCSFLIFYF